MRQFKSAIVVVSCVLTALVLAICGCTVGGEVEEYRDSEAHIMVEKGDEFAIVLESNPTTGYQWELSEPLDEEIVVLEKSEYMEPETDMLGAPGEEKWTFKAEGLGDTTISLIYVRPWEEDTEEEPAAESTSSEETEEGAQPMEDLIEEGQTDRVTFQVRVVKKGSMDKEAKKYDDQNTPIEVERDLKFAIVLESNPTTGYSWQLAQPLDDAVVELVSTEYERKSGGSEEGEGEAVGSGGEEIWTFLAVGAGDTSIEFNYVRAWEKDTAPEEEKSFDVTVSAPEEDSAHE